MGMGMGVGLTLMGMGKNGKAESHCRTLLNTSMPTSSSHNAVSKQLDDPLADSSLNVERHHAAAAAADDRPNRPRQ